MEVEVPKELIKIRNKKAYCLRGHRRSPSNIDTQNHCIKCKPILNRVRGIPLRKQKQDWFRALKQKPCLDCGQSYPSYVMDFDHRPGVLKKFELRKHLGFEVKAVLEEIEKCDLVCANCHRIRTFTRRGL